MAFEALENFKRNRPINGFYTCKLVLDKIFKEYERNNEVATTQEGGIDNIQPMEHDGDIDPVIPGAEAPIPAPTKTQFIEQMNAACEDLSKSYAENYNIGYSDLLIQAAYVKNAVTIHANIFVLCLNTFVNQSLNNLNFFDRPEFNFVSIGSGPGTELLGLLMFYFERRKDIVLKDGLTETKIRPYLYDCERNWEKIAKYFQEALESLPLVNLETEKLELKRAEFIHLDLVSEEFNSESPGIRNGDLFSLSYLMSELGNLPHDQKVIAVSNIQKLLDAAKIGAIFLFIDLKSKGNQNSTGDWIELIVDASSSMQRIDLGSRLDGLLANFQLEALKEEKLLLGGYFTVGAWTPRLRTISVCRMYKKVNPVGNETV